LSVSLWRALSISVALFFSLTKLYGTPNAKRKEPIHQPISASLLFALGIPYAREVLRDNPPDQGLRSLKLPALVKW
jgi:hypothetical protein